MTRFLTLLLQMPILGRLVELGMSIYHRQVGWPTIVRKTGEYRREQQPLMKKIQLLMLFNPILDYVTASKPLRYYLHDRTVDKYSTEEREDSRKQIQSFVEFYNVNMNDFEPSDISKYDNFQSFFTRKHKPGSRVIADLDDDSVAVVSADCRIVVYDTVSLAKRLWIKGHGFTIKNLLRDEGKATLWDNGAVALFRLSPQDYHRYHSPVSGTVKWVKQLGGEYYGVDPLAVNSAIDVLAVNDRTCIHIESPEFGNVMFVAIGAEDVGKIKINSQFKKEGTAVKKGDELGIFEFGGSSIIVLFEYGKIKWDQDLAHWSEKRIMVDVEVGNRMGRASRSKGE